MKKNKYNILKDFEKKVTEEKDDLFNEEEFANEKDLEEENE